MAGSENTMGKLATGQGVKVCQPTRPLDTKRHPLNFPSWVHNTLHHNQFTGSASQYPHDHLTRFLQLYVFVRLPKISEEHTRLILFPFSLEGNATMWLNAHPNHSLNFLNHFFPESRVEAIREKIINFRQPAIKSLFDAWERYKALLCSSPHHGYTKYNQISMFFPFHFFP